MPSARLCLAQIAVSAMDRTQLASRIEGAVGFRPRPGQVETVYKLVVDQQDLILIAPTGCDMILSQRQLTQGTIVVNVDQGNTQLTVMVSSSSGANSEASDEETTVEQSRSQSEPPVLQQPPPPPSTAPPAITGEFSSKRRRVQRGYYAAVMDDDSQEIKRRR
ncbi:uncharacterized protein VB005_01550 [Metarhizium brunneum]